MFDPLKLNNLDTLQYGWQHNDLTLLKKPIQLRLEDAWKHSPNNKLFVVHISRQVGKTMWALLVAIEECLANPNYRVVIVSHVETRLKEYFEDLVGKCLVTCPDDIKPEYVNTSLIFKNGSTVVLASDANQSFFSQRGHAYNLIILDEYAFYHSPKQLLWIVLYPTLTATKGKILITTTSPETSQHYSNELFEKAKLEGWYFKATIWEDETYSREEIEDLKNGCLDDFSWQINYECVLGITNKSKLIIPEYSKEYEHIIIPTQADPFYLKHIGLDFGFTNDKTVALFSSYRFLEGHLYIEDELDLSGPEMTPDVLGKLIKAKEEELWKNQKVSRRICDTNEPRTKAALGKMNLHFVGIKRKQGERGIKPSHAIINNLRDWMKAGRIVINPKCKLLIATLEGGIWADDERSDFIRNENIGHCDAISALSFLALMVDVTTNPVPPHLGMVETTVRSPNRIIDINKDTNKWVEGFNKIRDERLGIPNPEDENIRDDKFDGFF